MGDCSRAVLETLAGEERVAALPVSPRKRCIFFFRCAAPACPGPEATPLWHAPLTVDPTGVYFRPEGAPERPGGCHEAAALLHHGACRAPN